MQEPLQFYGYEYYNNNNTQTHFNLNYYSLNVLSDMPLKYFCHHHQPPCLINTWGPFAIDLDYLVVTETCTYIEKCNKF